MAKLPLKVDSFVLLPNFLLFLLLVGLLVYAKSSGDVGFLKRLFEKQQAELMYPLKGSLILISNFLWGLPTAICLFTFGILNYVSPGHRANLFFLSAGVGLGFTLLDEVSRITIYMVLMYKVPKHFIALLYGTIAIAFILYFWRKILSTPFLLLIVALILLVVSRVVDLSPLSHQETPGRILLEEGTKLLALLNLTLYFWLTCRQEIIKVLAQHTSF